ncbi:ABC transporter permease [Saccharibacillus alkalitolerans]|uniref:ABC transporter permease n=1 Tax=Saccharibacillus alkalitolerans TaxID=2705290 RepID=A0ABX0F4K6_9BACL|nr:ABC transporter permease [Saccharibacillus alkalitolerans]NGZ75298.1 ABC transporter permease [Saccharibacillus alkalitolerans]
MDNLLALSGYQIKLVMRNAKSLILGFSLPIVMFFIFSNLLAGYKVDGGVPLTELLVPAYIPIIIVNGVLVIYGQTFLLYKEQGNLLKFKLLGISGLTVSSGLYIATFLFQIAASFLLIAFAAGIKHIAIPYASLPNIAVAFLLINLYQFAITYFLTSFIGKSVTYQGVSQMVFYYQIFLGGLTFPPEMFPSFLREFVYIFNPIVYGLEMMRGLWAGSGTLLDYGKEALILVGVSLAFVAAGAVLQKKFGKLN